MINCDVCTCTCDIQAVGTHIRQNTHAHLSITYTIMSALFNILNINTTINIYVAM